MSMLESGWDPTVTALHSPRGYRQTLGSPLPEHILVGFLLVAAPPLQPSE